VLCVFCGWNLKAGGIAMVEYRRGDWFYSAPHDESQFLEAHVGSERSRTFILTRAYNRATRERVVVGADSSLAEQELALSQRGLTVDPQWRLQTATIRDLPSVSMMREGCVITQLAFVGAAIVWLVFGGIAALIAIAIRRRRREPRAHSPG
jgi:hypothetical protein